MRSLGLLLSLICCIVVTLLPSTASAAERLDQPTYDALTALYNQTHTAVEKNSMLRVNDCIGNSAPSGVYAIVSQQCQITALIIQQLFKVTKCDERSTSKQSIICFAQVVGTLYKSQQLALGLNKRGDKSLEHSQCAQILFNVPKAQEQFNKIKKVVQALKVDSFSPQRLDNNWRQYVKSLSSNKQQSFASEMAMFSAHCSPLPV